MDLSVLCLPGDGIGPDVVAAAERVLERVAVRFGHRLEVERHDFAGVAWDRTGTGFPDETRAACAGARAILLGGRSGIRGTTCSPPPSVPNARCWSCAGCSAPTRTCARSG